MGGWADRAPFSLSYSLPTLSLLSTSPTLSHLSLHHLHSLLLSFLVGPPSLPTSTAWACVLLAAGTSGGSGWTDRGTGRRLEEVSLQLKVPTATTTYPTPIHIHTCTATADTYLTCLVPAPDPMPDLPAPPAFALPLHALPHTFYTCPCLSSLPACPSSCSCICLHTFPTFPTCTPRHACLPRYLCAVFWLALPPLHAPHTLGVRGWTWAGRRKVEMCSSSTLPACSYPCQAFPLFSAPLPFWLHAHTHTHVASMACACLSSSFY